MKRSAAIAAIQNHRRFCLSVNTDPSAVRLGGAGAAFILLFGCCLCAPIRQTKEMLFDANYRAFAFKRTSHRSCGRSLVSPCQKAKSQSSLATPMGANACATTACFECGFVNSRPKCSSRVETTGPAGTDETRNAQANVARFKLLLETQTDPKRAMLTKLIAEEEGKPTQIARFEREP